MDLVQAKMAAVFDDNHEPPLLHDQVYVRLTRRPGSTGYTILQSSKLSPVMKGPFNIKRRVGRLTYELDLPDDWDIHPVISVVHLEQAYADAYDRSLECSEAIVACDITSKREIGMGSMRTSLIQMATTTRSSGPNWRSP